jgi:hypothetical protein
MEMSKWILSHLPDPFLAKEDENYFMAKYAMSRKQVKTAFNNRRQRVAGPFRTLRENLTQKFIPGQFSPGGFQAVIPIPIYITHSIWLAP